MICGMESFQKARVAGSAVAQFAAAEVRAEMARQRKSQGELAEVLGLTAQTVGRRLSGVAPFDVIELTQVAIWLGVSVTRFLPTAEQAAS